MKLSNQTVKEDRIIAKCGTITLTVYDDSGEILTVFSRRFFERDAKKEREIYTILRTVLADVIEDGSIEVSIAEEMWTKTGRIVEEHKLNVVPNKYRSNFKGSLMFAKLNADRQPIGEGETSLGRRFVISLNDKHEPLIECGGRIFRLKWESILTLAERDGFFSPEVYS